MKTLGNSLFSLGIPVLYGFVLRAFFLDDLSSLAAGIASFAFIVLGPMCIGALTAALAPKEWSMNVVYSLFAPWAVILIFLALTFVLKFEGGICLIMALPVFLLCASIGGFIIWLVRRHKLNNKINVIATVLIPFLVSPIEKTIDFKPQNYEAYTTIIIEAPKEKIWENVVRVKEIKEIEDNGKLSKYIGFPRPIKAELDTLSAGGKRKAIFDKGLVFDETVLAYEHEKKMNFSITPLTEEIPPTTLDEHVTVGGRYFTVLDGTYEIEPLSPGKYKLILYSHFRLTTSFNFYSGLWAELIMKDIQDNILQIIKKRSAI
ncbi:MAG: hypothetical protein K8I03_11150 [Ignavibacteria bacterium]|nr:hypothetical protein [Ignavibacteria bacterium]